MYVPPAPVDGFMVACGTGVGAWEGGFDVADGCAVGATLVFVGLGTGVSVGAAAVGVGGTEVAVGTGVTVGVGEGGPGGGPIGVGTVAGGGGGVLAAAYVCGDDVRNGLLTMISPAVNGTATSKDKRLFIQDSLRAGFAFGSPVCRKYGTAAQSLSLRDVVTLARLGGQCVKSTGPHTGRDKEESQPSFGSLHHPFRSRSADFHHALRLSISIIQGHFQGVNEDFTIPSRFIHTLFMMRGGHGASVPSPFWHLRWLCRA